MPPALTQKEWGMPKPQKKWLPAVCTEQPGDSLPRQEEQRGSSSCSSLWPEESQESQRPPHIPQGSKVQDMELGRLRESIYTTPGVCACGAECVCMLLSENICMFVSVKWGEEGVSIFL